jgi:TRAP-type C4-dicarboxylate transport system permease small subunit
MRRATLVKYTDRWALLAILFFLAFLVVIYWGDEYASPAWDEQSIPAPRTY